MLGSCRADHNVRRHSVVATSSPGRRRWKSGILGVVIGRGVYEATNKRLIKATEKRLVEAAFKRCPQHHRWRTLVSVAVLVFVYAMAPVQGQVAIEHAPGN